LLEKIALIEGPNEHILNAVLFGAFIDRGSTNLNQGMDVL